MLAPFYDPPLAKDVGWYIGRIEDEFSTKVKSFDYLDRAFDHDVFIVNHRLVFRFPKTERYRQHLLHEVNLLTFLQDRVDVAVPRYRFISKDKSFAGYELIPGETLTATVFHELSQAEKEKAIDQLIAFVNSYHRVDLVRFAEFEPRRREDFLANETRVKIALSEHLFPRLSTRERTQIEGFYKEAESLVQSVPILCATHGDLYAYNVLWNEQASGIGIIDFSDALVGDPAKDFEVFYDYGGETAESAYARYQGPKDAHFLERAKTYWKLHGIYTLLSSLLGAKISYEQAYRQFFKPRFPDP